MTTHAIECPKCRTLLIYETPKGYDQWRLICPGCQASLYHAKAERLA